MGSSLIAGADEMKHLGIASKFNAEIEFILHLKNIGRRCAGAWLDTHADDIGVRSTVNLGEMFL
jgi:NTE family protein